MSQENVEVVHQFVDAFQAHDVASLIELFSPDCEIVALRSAFEGTFRGREGVRRWAESVYEAAPDSGFTAERVVPAHEERAVLLGRQTGTARLGGASFDAPVGAIFEFESGLVRRIDSYTSHAEALKAAGLQE
jgi:ketosteroid isomerase-like protein